MKDSSSRKKDSYWDANDLSPVVDMSWAPKLKRIKERAWRSKDASWKIQDTIFKVKIADLLNETWRADQIDFDHKFSHQLSNLTEEGMSWTFTIQSLDTSSLLGTLTDVLVNFNETCDSCGTSFLRVVEIPSYTVRFLFEKDALKEEKTESEEAVLYIDDKDETINIEDMIVQAILLNDPFVKRCNDCTQRLAGMSDDDDLGDFWSTGNINFS